MGEGLGVGVGSGVGVTVGPGVGSVSGSGVGLGVGLGVGVAWTALLTVIVVLSHGPTKPAGTLCQTMFWPLGPILVTVVSKPATFVQTSWAPPILVPLAKFGTWHSAGASDGWGEALGLTSTGSPDPAKLVMTTAVADDARGIVSPTMSPITGVARRKVARTDTR